MPNKDTESMEIASGSLSDMEALFGDMGSAAAGDMTDMVVQEDEEIDEDTDRSDDLFGEVTVLKEKRYDKETAAVLGKSNKQPQEKLNYAPKRPEPEKIIVNGKVYTDVTGLITDTYSSEL